MVTRRVAMISALAGLVSMWAPPANTAEPSAKEFVAAIYKSYQGKDAKGILIDSPRAKSLLTPGLMALIDAEAKRAARRGEAPRLDGDPFIDAQDFEDIGAVTIDITEKVTVAVAKVGFTNFGEKKSVTLNLVKTGGSWRIDDFAEPTSVRKMLGRKK